MVTASLATSLNQDNSNPARESEPARSLISTPVRSKPDARMEITDLANPELKPSITRNSLENLFARYLKEREGLEVLYTSIGFVTYKFRVDGCYIQDIFVLPEYRQQHCAAEMADIIAKEAKALGYRLLLGSVDSRANGAEISDRVLRAYGMRPYSREGFMTYYGKEI